MKTFSLLLLGLAVTCLTTTALHAQGPGGCVNSPENPTAILAAVGSAGAVLFSRFKR